MSDAEIKVGSQWRRKADGRVVAEVLRVENGRVTYLCDDDKVRPSPWLWRPSFLELFEPISPPAVDMVNHPPHYTSHPSGVECIQVTEHMGFNLGNAVKYLWRADLKNGLEDLKKAQWYLDREIGRREKGGAA